MSVKPFTKQDVAQKAQLSETERDWLVNRINKGLAERGSRTFSVDIFSHLEGEVNERVLNQIFTDWTVRYVPDARDGSYYEFS